MEDIATSTGVSLKRGLNPSIPAQIQPDDDISEVGSTIHLLNLYKNK